MIENYTDEVDHAEVDLNCGDVDDIIDEAGNENISDASDDNIDDGNKDIGDVSDGIDVSNDKNDDASITTKQVIRVMTISISQLASNDDTINANEDDIDDDIYPNNQTSDCCSFDDGSNESRTRTMRVFVYQ